MTPSLVSVLVAELEQNPDARDALRRLLDEHDDGHERLLTPREAADRLNLHVKTVTRMAREGRIRGACRVGPKLWRFREAELEVLAPTRSDLAPGGTPRPRRAQERSATTSAILKAGGIER